MFLANLGLDRGQGVDPELPEAQMDDPVDEPVGDDVGPVVLLQPADGALQLHKVVMEIPHRPTSPEILASERFIAKEDLVADVHLECQPLKVDPGLDPGVPIA
jgi:hypothetical protein